MTLSSCSTIAAFTTMVALSRNRPETPHRLAPLTVADLEVEALSRRIRHGEREVKLSPDEHVLLYTLLASVGVVVTYRELATALGFVHPEIRTNTIARHVATLRKKLMDDAGHPRYIETVVRLGYGVRASPRVPLTQIPPRPARAPSS